MIRSRPLWLACACALLLACDDGDGPAAVTEDAAADVGLRLDGGAGSDASPTCVPSEERCNARDDDCDGRADETFEGLGEVCRAGDGPCAQVGRQICAADEAQVVCDASPRTPTDELCNGIDDDCDGAADEGIDLARDAQNCGGCGRACTFDNGGGRCVEGVCELAACMPGFGDADGLPFNGCECVETGDERCDGVDDDCDGATDEGFDLGGACTVGDGACAVSGVRICAPDGTAQCDAVPGAPADEACNGIDDDCDGAVDEGFDADGDGFAGCGIDCAGPCPAGVDCAALCPVQDCADDDGDLNPLAADLCGDGIDQNCDGRDAPCGRTSSFMTRLEIVPDGVEAPCRDLDGDGVPDNAFAGLAALVHGLLAQSIAEGSLTLLPSVEGLPPGVEDGRFDLSLLRGRRQGLGRVQITPDSFDANGVPLMLFPNALLVAGALTAGPGDFQLGLPVPGGQPGELRVADAVITGQLRFDDGGLSITDGTVSGVVSEADLMAGLVAIPPALAPLVLNLLVADIDQDGDGIADAYSTCLTWDAGPIQVVE